MADGSALTKGKGSIITKQLSEKLLNARRRKGVVFRTRADIGITVLFETGGDAVEDEGIFIKGNTQVTISGITNMNHEMHILGHDDAALYSFQEI